MRRRQWSYRLAPMLRARRFDETLIEYRALVTDVYHVSIGQEATAAAIAISREPGDVLMLNHRNHAHIAANGADLELMFRELFGRDGGPQRGRSGSLHLADAEHGAPYTSAMVGGGVPLALGIAWAKKRRGEEGIAFCTFGDGAMGEGIVHECLNIARLWELPVVLVCESNAAPAGEQANAFQAAARLVDLAVAHRVPGTVVDATQPAAAVEEIAAVAAAVRSAGGPHFVEARSVPWPGNRTFLATSPEGPVDLATAAGPAPAGWPAADPVLNEVRQLLGEGVGLDAVLELDNGIRSEVESAARSAAAASRAPASAAFENVWADG